jgi:fibronectin-binding autotransporter adhesin
MIRRTILSSSAVIMLATLIVFSVQRSTASGHAANLAMSVGYLSWLSGAVAPVLQVSLATQPTDPPAVRPDVKWMRGGHTSYIREPAYFPDGTGFVTASSDTTVKVWRSSDNMVLRTFYPFDHGILHLDLSADGQTLAVAGSDRDPVNTNLTIYSIKIYNTSDGSLRHTIALTGNSFSPYNLIEFSPIDPSLLAAATGYAGVIQIWNTTTGSLYRSFDGTASYGSDYPTIKQQFAFHPNGEWIAGLTSDSGGVIIRISDGSIVVRWTNYHNGFGYPNGGAYEFSPDGKIMLSGRWGGDAENPPTSLTAWNVDPSQCFRNTYNNVWSCDGSGVGLLDYYNSGVVAENYAFSPDGSKLVLGGRTSGGNALNRVWNTTNWSVLRSYTSNPKLSTDGKAALVSFSPDGGSLMSAAEDIRKYDPVTGDLQEIVTGQIGPVHSVAFSPDGQYAASVTNMQRHAALQLFSAESGELLRSIDLSETVTPYSNPTPRVIFSPDSQQVIAVIHYTAGSEIRIFDVPTGELAKSIEDSSTYLGQLHFMTDPSGSGEKLLAVPSSQRIRLYRLSDATAVRDIQVSHDARDYAFSPEGASLFHLATGAPRLINTVTGNTIRDYTATCASPRNLSLSPSGNFFVTGTDSSSSNSLCIYTTDQSQPVETIPVGGRVTEITFAPDSESFIAFTADGRAKVFRTIDGVELYDYDQEVGILSSSANTQISSAAYSPDGSKIFWGRGDATVVMAANPLYIPPTNSISGRVTENGAGLAGVSVTISGSSSGSATTDSAGNYAFAGLTRNGSYTLTPALVNYSFAPADMTIAALTADNTTADFSAARNLHTISGTTGVANATVTLRETTGGAAIATTVSGSGGSYSFENVPAGASYLVSPQLPRYAFAPAQRTVPDLSSNMGNVDFAASIDPGNASVLIFRETFASYTGNHNQLQPGTGFQLSFGGNVPGWTKSGGNAVHAVNLGGGNYAATFVYDNRLMLNDPIQANALGSSYTVSFDAGPSVYTTMSQATQATDGLVIKLVNSSGGVVASHTVLPGAWVTGPNAQDLTGYSFSYQGNGTGPVRFEISTVNPSAVRFGGAIDNLTVSRGPIFHENFNSYSNGNQNSLQPGTGLQLSYGGNVPGWARSGFNAVHAVNLGGGDFAPSFYKDNTITTASTIAANDAGVGYLVTFDAAPSVYFILGQATLSNDGLIVKLLRGDNTVLATHSVLPGAWVTGADAQDLSPYSFSYVGDGSGPVRLEVSTVNPTADRFGGAIDNVSIFSDVAFYSISGRVFAADGVTPLSGINVDLSDGSSTVTNANGEYSFGLLQQAGDYTITPANTSQYLFTPQTVSNLQSNRTLNFTATSACSYSVPAAASVSPSGGSYSVQVTASAGCAWTASSNAAWITVTSGASGVGTGPVGYSVAANNGTSARTGTITIAGRTFTVDQGISFTISDGDVSGLIAAINSANSSPGTDIINLASRGTYTLTAAAATHGFRGSSGLPTVITPIIINANGATIRRSDAAEIPRFRIFDISAGDLTLYDVVIRGGLASLPAGGTQGWGGGILNSDNGKLSLMRSTVTGNSANDGGGVVSRCSTTTIENSTISHNTAVTSAGGVINHASGCTSSATIVSSTLYANQVAPGGFGDAVGGAVTLKNSIVASTSRGSTTECNVPMISLGYNIVSDGTCGPNSSGGDRIISGLQLGQLAYNGGLTPTHALPLGSLAIDHIPASACTNALGAAITTDQRGVPRPQNGMCDIGGYENKEPINVAAGDVAALIAAINTANANPGPDVISLAADSSYTLTAPAGTDGFRGAFGLPSITSQVAIRGNGGFIERSDAPGTPDFRVVDVFSGDLTLIDVTIRGGQASVSAGGLQGNGGGILNNNNSRVTLMNSTVTGNTASDGGGIANICSGLVVENSTISFNTSSNGGRGGAGIMNRGGAGCSGTTISSSTIYENRSNFPRGHNISDNFSPQPAITLKNSIVSSPTRGGAGGDCYASPSSIMPLSLGHNIFGDNSCPANTMAGDRIVTNFALSALADNGGPTPTHAPLFQSAAINAIPTANCTNAAGDPVLTDQRGESRPKGGACDVGAVEHFDLTPPVIFTPGNINVPATGPTGGIVSYQVTAQDAFEGPVTATCAPASGSSLPLGTTVISCSASDSSGNSTSASFNIYVYIPGFVISGSVGVPNATVTVRRVSNGQIVSTAASGPDGSYSSTPLTPWVDYTVTPTLAGHHFFPLQRTVTNLSAHRTNVDFSVTDDANCHEGDCLVVNTTADAPDANLSDGFCDVDVNIPGEQCALRAAVQIANSRPAADRIVFDMRLRGGTIVLTSGSEIEVTNNGPLTIVGPGADLLTIEGGPGDNRILYVNLGTASISGLKFSGGGGAGARFPAGGAILAYDASLTLDGVNVTGNSTTGDGGGVFVRGTYNFTNSRFTGNSAGNWGGAISFYPASGSITDSVITDNTAVIGGGIYSYPQVPVNVFERILVSGNSAAATAGGVHLTAPGGGTHKIIGSTFTGNSTNGSCGAINNTVTLVLLNSTISGNTAQQNGSGLCSSGAGTTVRNSTIAYNSATTGTGAVLHSAGAFSFGNTIIAANAGGVRPEISWSGGTLMSEGNNLVGDSSNHSSQTGNPVSYQPTDIRDQDPRLAPLGNYGGRTPTHALLINSPAFNAGSNALAADPLGGAALTTDQRGPGFARIANGTVDIGAVEDAVFTVNRSTDEADVAAGDGLCDTDPNSEGEQCSLRAAVQEANASPGNATIRFDLTQTGSLITLSGSEIQVANNGHLSIGGPGANHLTIDGGAGTNRIFYTGDATVSISGVTLTGGGGTGTSNAFGGAVMTAAGGALTLEGVHVTGNSSTSGGGVFLRPGTHKVSNSTVSNNAAQGCGGGIHNQGALTIVNSTISANTSTGYYGGGICNDGFGDADPTLTIRNATIVANSAQRGGGIYNFDGVADIGNTLLAANTATYPEIYLHTGSFISAGNNLIGDSPHDSAQSGLVVSYAPSDIRDVNPQILPLANYGGSTPTHGPSAGSPVLNAGNNALAVDPSSNAPLVTDQRGAGFARVKETTVDIGAVEGVAVTYTIGGRVFAEDGVTGLAGIPVGISGGGSAVTNAAGEFTFAGLTAGGNYTITPQSNAIFLFTPQSVTGLQSDQTLNFTAARRTYSISGSVGTPNRTVTLRNPVGGTVISTTVSDASGSYAFAALPAGRDYVLSPQADSAYSFSPPFASIIGLQADQVLNFAPLPYLFIDDVSLHEPASGNSTATFTVSLSASASQPVTVDVSTSDDTAASPGDYSPIALQQIIFAPGETSKQVQVSINSDGDTEILETFFVDLSDPSNATIGKGRGAGAILSQFALNGKISFHSNFSGDHEVYSMNADGSGTTNLTNYPGPGDFDATFSPDGSKIVFRSFRDGNSEVYVMNADGSDVARLTNDPASDHLPSFSPDGRKIVFNRDLSATVRVIFVMDTDGSNVRQLTNNAAIDTAPSYSPDGRRIVFHSNRDGNNEIYVMDAEGGNQTRLTTHNALESYPSFSPDGSKILFNSSRNSGNEMFVMNADGTAITRLTNGTSDSIGAFSPDGSKIVFLSRRNAKSEIFVMNSDGTGQVRIATAATDLNFPKWQPATSVSISGRVFADDGATGISGITVELSNGSNTTTDGSGNYSFAGVRTGSSYTITAQGNALYSFAPQPAANLQANRTVDLTATRNTYSVSGSVGLEGVGVTLRNAANNQTIGSVTSGTGGAYSFVGIPAGYNYNVTPALSGHYFLPAQLNVSNLLSDRAGVDFTVTDRSECQNGSCLIVNSTLDSVDANLNDGFCDIDTSAPGEQCTLRAAVQIANARPANDTIAFDLRLAGSTIVLTSATEIVITNNGFIAIHGLGPDRLTIDGGPGTNRLFFINGATASVNRLKLTGGNGAGLNGGHGGAVHAQNATLLFDSVSLSGNTSTSMGGGLFAANTNSSITSSELSGNTSVSGGGALAVSGGTVNLDRVTSTGNSSTSGSGGAIALFVNSGTSRIVNSVFSNNSAFNGGGIFVQGGGNNTAASAISLDNVQITGNTIHSYGWGGGLYLYSWGNGSINLSNSTISNNAARINGARGGGVHIDAYDGSITLNAVTISDNVSPMGAGLSARTEALRAVVRVVDSAVRNNTAGTLSTSGIGGGIYAWGNSGTLRFEDTRFTGNTSFSDGGGGFFDQNGATTIISGSTFSTNSAGYHCGGFAGRSVKIFNSTVSGNVAKYYGSGLCNYGNTDLRNVTVTNNTRTTESSGSGIYNGGTLTLGNSIIAGNTGIYPEISNFSIVTSMGNNLIGSRAGDSFKTGQPIAYQLTDVRDQDPLLDPLAENGGATQTHALLPGSPAANAGSNALAVDPVHQPFATDQRGAGFERIKFGAVDIGAFESDISAQIPAISWNPQMNTTYGTPIGSAHLNATASYNGTPVQGTFVYNPPAGSVLSAGTQALSVTFTPSDTSTLSPVTRSVSVNINKASTQTTAFSESFTSSSSVILKAVVRNSDTGAAVCQGNTGVTFRVYKAGVQVYTNGIVCNTATGLYQVSANITSAGDGTYTVYAFFNGDVNHNGSSGVGNLAVGAGAVLSPSLGSLSPISSPDNAISPLTLTVNGSGFGANSAVLWRDPITQIKTSLAVTSRSSTQMQAIVPVELLARADAYQITVDNTPANTTDGESTSQTFFVTAEPVLVTGVTSAVPNPSTNTTTASVSGSAGTVSATASTTTGTTATGTVTLAEYQGDPVGTSASSGSSTTTFSSTGGYYDVHVSSGSTYSTLSLNFCNTGGSTLYWYDGAEWKRVSPQTYSTTTRCISVTLNNSTTNPSSPTISQLTGTVIAAAGGPEIQTVTVAPGAPVVAGTAVALNAVFTDPDGPEGSVYRAEINWGDGTTTPTAGGSLLELTGTSSPFTAMHVYNVPGVYKVNVKITRTIDGAFGSSSNEQFVVVYNPTGGFVTGGGWINSPLGAYLHNPELVGRANFGFSAKYQQGTSIPTGETQFNFNASGMNFKSESYQWLVVAGARAQFKGTGRINGSGNFGFLLSAIDGQVNGGGGTDKFRIKIWDIASGNVVYDNNRGRAEGDAPTTALGGGSIVVHRP